MMTVVALTTLVSTVSVVAVTLDRRWQKRKQATATEAPPEATAEATADTPGRLAALTSTVTDRVSAGVRSGTSWLSSVRRKKSTDLPEQFRAWVDKAGAIETPVKEWIHTLSAPGLQAFTEHLDTFCAEMGFELAWLVEQQFDQNPDLARAVEKIVLPYCRACQQAATAQEDLEAHKRLQAFERHPSHRKQQAFGQQLFAKLSQEGLTTVSTAEYLNASRHKQQQHTLQAIHEAVHKDSAAFNRALKEVIRSVDTPVEPAEPAAPPSADTPEPVTAAAPA